MIKYLIQIMFLFLIINSLSADNGFNCYVKGILPSNLNSINIDEIGKEFRKYNTQKDTIGKNEYMPIMLALPYRQLDAEVSQAIRMNKLNTYKRISIVFNSFYHDKVYSPSLFQILISDSCSKIYYISKKDSFKSLILSVDAISIIEKYISNNSNSIVNCSGDDAVSMYCLIENINHQNCNRQMIAYRFADEIENSNSLNYIKSYIDFLDLLKRLVTEMRCQN